MQGDSCRVNAFRGGKPRGFFWKIIVVFASMKRTHEAAPGSAVKVRTMHSDNVYMHIALDEAWKAYEAGEVPVGAILLSSDGTILGRSYNQTISRNDPTAHAEMLALREAAEVLGNYRLLNTKLYVTVEPCIMCAGALIHARVEEVIYGAPDPKWGGLTSLYALGCDARLNHRLTVVSGVLEYDCGELIKRFFREKRQPPADAPLLTDPFST